MNIISVIIFISLIVLVVGGANLFLYNMLRTAYGIEFNKIFLMLVVVLGLLSIISMIPLYFKGKNILNFIGAYYTGFFLYLIMSLVIFYILEKLFKLIGLSINIRTVTVSLSIVAALLIFSYGVYNRSNIKTVYYDVNLDKKLKNPIKIALISDLHFGAVSSNTSFKKTVDIINKESPDLVLIPGDIFNDNYSLIQNREELIKMFKSIKPRLGIFASIGNHDGSDDFNSNLKFLEDANIKLLSEEYYENGEVCIVGRVDPHPINSIGDNKRKDTKEFMNTVKTKLPIIVLDHNPKDVLSYDENTSLIVSGHTHKGQVFPGNLMTKKIYFIDYGFKTINNGKTNIIVTSGSGTWGPPIRVGSDSEVAIINLK